MCQLDFWHHLQQKKNGWKDFLIWKLLKKTWMDINFLHKVKPDFVKLMSDGYFAYPNQLFTMALKTSQIAEDWTAWSRSSMDHRAGEQNPCRFWRRHCGYLQYLLQWPTLKWLVGEVSGGDDLITNFIDQMQQLLKKYWIQAKILQVWANESSKAGADRIYLSVQSIQDARVTQRSL